MNSSRDIFSEKPLVSVGIPTYNRPEGLRRTLECITGQTYRNLEIIVSDNCSPGSETEDIVREVMSKDSRIQYYRQEENYGPTNNLKFVLERATGEYFMWASDDDEWDHRFVERLLDLLRNSDVDVAMCSVKRVDDFDNVVDITRYQFLLEPDYNQFQMAIFAAGHDIVTFYIYGLYRTMILRKFSKNLDNTFGKDLVILCELILSAKKLGYVDEVLHIRHIHNKGTAELYSQEEIGKYYGDPFNYLRLFLNFGPYLLKSSNISLKRKFWIPFMVVRQGIWVGGIYLNRIFNMFLSVARKNSTLDKIAILLSKKLKNRKRSE